MDKQKFERLAAALDKPDIGHYREPTVTIAASVLRTNMSDVLKRAFYRVSKTSITEYGKPTATIVHPDDAEFLSALRDSGLPADIFSKKLQHVFGSGTEPP